MKWSVVLALVAGCSTATPPAPQVVVVERVVYVERAPAPEAVERVEPGPPLEPSPLVAAAEEQPEERAAVAPEPAVVYVPVAVERSEPRRLSMLERQRLERELGRCDRRGTKWARERCEERARAR
jgi:hypothetical protein